MSNEQTKPSAQQPAVRDIEAPLMVTVDAETLPPPNDEPTQVDLKLPVDPLEDPTP